MSRTKRAEKSRAGGVLAQPMVESDVNAGKQLRVSVKDRISLFYGGVLAQRETSPIQRRVNEAHYTLLFVNQGSLNIRIEDEPFVAVEGQSLMLFPDERFVGGESDGTDVVCQWMHFGVTRSRHRGENDEVSVPRLATAWNPGRVMELFRLLIEDVRSGMQERDATHFLALTLLSELGAPEPSVIRPASALTALAERGKDYVRMSFASPISSVDIARALDCSAGYLRKAFHEAYGYTPSDYLVQMRLHNARELLIGTRLSVHSIAVQCGFETPGYFSRVFKRNQGMTPREYRILHSLKYTVPGL